MTTKTVIRMTLLALVLGLAACGDSQGPDQTDGSSTPVPIEEAKPRRLPADGLVLPQDLARYTSLPDPPLLLDVRLVSEHESARIPGSLLIPIQELPRRLAEVEAGREQGVILYCRSGRRARAARGILERAGFHDIALLDGSMQRWEKEGRPVEKGAVAN